MTLKKFFHLVMALCVFVAAAGCSDKISNTVNSPEDISGKKLGVVSGTVAEIMAMSLEYENVTLSVYENEQTAASALKTGLVDCLLLDAAFAEEVTQEYSGIKTLEETIQDGHFAFAVAKENPDLKKALNKALAALKLSGIYDSIISGYMAGDEYRYEVKTSFEKTITLGVDVKGAPFCYKDDEGTIVGIEPDLARALCEIMEVSLEIVEKEPDDLVPSTQKGRVTFAPCQLKKSDEASDVVDFTDEYYLSQQSILVRK